jgi:hypothetical protein
LQQLFTAALRAFLRKCQIGGRKRHLKAEIKATWILNDAIFKSPVHICIRQATNYPI